MKSNHITILKTLSGAGFSAYIVGGFVRDHLLGLPSKDIDITTSATPEEVKGLFPGADFVGAHFGISLVKTDDGETIEVATYRTDGIYKDARHPSSVTFTNDVRVDVSRRDFSVNALLMDLNGNVIDHYGGLDDLKSRLICAVGEPTLRFQEDALRMLRAVRFARQLGFEIEGKTMDGIRACANRILMVSSERVAQELSRILTSGRAARGIELLSTAGLLNYILPEIEILKDCPQSKKWHPEGDVYVHTLALLRNLTPGCSLTLALGALLHDVGKPATLKFKADGSPTSHGHAEAGEPIAEAILRRLKFSNEDVDTVKSHVRQHMIFPALPEMRKAKQLRFIGQSNFLELLELHRLDSLAGVGDLSSYRYAGELLAATPQEVLHPVRLITGHDLIRLGLKPGPLFREVLDEIELLQLDGKVQTREECVAIVLAKSESFQTIGNAVLSEI